jgi:RNA 3'-terminal phosphate cyclase (ATP)
VETKDSVGPGNVLMVECHAAEVVHVFTGFGKVGVSAEAVAGEAVTQARTFVDRKVAADEHLADQLLLPMAIGSGGSFSTLKLSNHSLTNMTVIKEFLSVHFEIESRNEGDTCVVTVVSKR